MLRVVRKTVSLIGSKTARNEAIIQNKGNVAPPTYWSTYSFIDFIDFSSRNVGKQIVDRGLRIGPRVHSLSAELKKCREDRGVAEGGNVRFPLI